MQKCCHGEPDGTITSNRLKCNQSQNHLALKFGFFFLLDSPFLNFLILFLETPRFVLPVAGPGGVTSDYRSMVVSRFPEWLEIDLFENGHLLPVIIFLHSSRSVPLNVSVLFCHCHPFTNISHRSAAGSPFQWAFHPATWSICNHSNQSINRSTATMWPYQQRPGGPPPPRHPGFRPPFYQPAPPGGVNPDDLAQAAEQWARMQVSRRKYRESFCC